MTTPEWITGHPLTPTDLDRSFYDAIALMRARLQHIEVSTETLRAEDAVTIIEAVLDEMRHALALIPGIDTITLWVDAPTVRHLRKEI